MWLTAKENNSSVETSREKLHHGCTNVWLSVSWEWWFTSNTFPHQPKHWLCALWWQQHVSGTVSLWEYLHGESTGYVMLSRPDRRPLCQPVFVWRVATGMVRESLIPSSQTPAGHRQNNPPLHDGRRWSHPNIFWVFRDFSLSCYNVWPEVFHSLRVERKMWSDREREKWRGGVERKVSKWWYQARDFPLQGGNSSDLNAAPHPSIIITHITLPSSYEQAALFLSFFFFSHVPGMISVSERCPNKLKQHESADSSTRLMDSTVTETSCALRLSVSVHNTSRSPQFRHIFQSRLF